jgi:hypothetical protein
MPHAKDYADDDNIFSEDYMTDRLFEEEDEELGIDVHEIGLGEPKKAAHVREEYKKHGSIEGLPEEHLKSNFQVTKGRMTAKMRSKGYTKVVLYKGIKKVILT